MQSDRDEVTATEPARNRYQHYLSLREALTNHSHPRLWEESCRDCGLAWGYCVQIPFGKESVGSYVLCLGCLNQSISQIGVLGREHSYPTTEPHAYIPLNPKQVSGWHRCRRLLGSLRH